MIVCHTIQQVRCTRAFVVMHGHQFRETTLNLSIIGEGQGENSID